MFWLFGLEGSGKIISKGFAMVVRRSAAEYYLQIIQISLEATDGPGENLHDNSRAQ